jgi:glycosyltransferase involved in cell wall biosynthesis
MVVHSRYPHDPRVAREAKAARNAGYEVEVIALRESGEARREVVDGITIRRMNVSHRLWQGSAGLAAVLIEYLSFGLRAGVAVTRRAVGRRAFDTLQVHNPPDFLVFTGLIPKLLGRRVILDVHDRSPLIYAARFGRGRLGRIAVAGLDALEGLACRFADHVLTVHEPYGVELSRHGVSAKDLTVVMNSPGEDLIRRVRDIAEPRVDPSTFVVAYHGTITSWYGLPLVVAALGGAKDSLGQWRAVFLGEGDALEQTQMIARRLGIAERIEFSRGYLPIEEALARVSVADCGVIPNLPSPLNQLTLSTKLLEYVALGVPAVVARLDTLAMHFDENEVTFFDAGDASALCDALRWVRAHPDEAAAKAERARARYDSYAWPANRDRYIAALERTGTSWRRTRRSLGSLRAVNTRDGRMTAVGQGD